MCGIAGIISSDRCHSALQREHMRRMLAMIRHRGPDQFGIYQDSDAILGSARLSIIDLSAGQQPISNEDGTLWIVFNGEVFNYVELRPDLESRGHRFTTNTDTEVVLHLYEDFGSDCLHHLNGEFAFAIWEPQKLRLFLARDRFGIRPLFHTQSGGSFLFASEMKALLAYPGVCAEIDPVTVDQIFTYWSPLPGRTVFRGIREIPAAHLLIHSDGRTAVKRYWDLSFPPEKQTLYQDGPLAVAEKLEEFQELLTDATLIRLRSDVPVGAYLSGGLDSSLLARLITTTAKKQLTTFSVTFDDPEFDESKFQMRMAHFLGTKHEVVHATHADIARVFPEVIRHTETPITRTAPAPIFLLSKLVRDSGFKVVLTGEGADEVLAGYDIFKEAAVRRFWARHPESGIRPLLLRRLYADIPGLASTSTSFFTAFFRSGLSEVDSPYYSHLVRWRNNARTRRFFSGDAADAIARGISHNHLVPELPPSFMTWGQLQRAQYLESTIFLSQYLLCSQGDRMAMAHSVESRLPFLDYRVVEFCNRLPAALKLRGLKDKYLLRRLGRDLLPPEVCERPKRPYRAPIHRSFFCKPMPDYVRELLSPERLKVVQLFNPAGVAQLTRKATAGVQLGETDNMALAGILSTQLVHFHFVSNFTSERPISENENDIKICGASSAILRENVSTGRSFERNPRRAI
jgi:asparagine synthase (glutamine-hydrolysing)